MKNYEVIQLLLVDLRKQQKKLSLAIEDTNVIINSTTVEGYKKLNIDYLKRLKSLIVVVEKSIAILEKRLKCQGFDFGEIFTKSEKEIQEFYEWFNYMLETKGGV